MNKREMRRNIYRIPACQWHADRCLAKEGNESRLGRAHSARCEGFMEERTRRVHKLHSEGFGKLAEGLLEMGAKLLTNEEIDAMLPVAFKSEEPVSE